MGNMSIESSCSEEAPQDLKHTELEKEVQAANAVLSGCTYWTCPVSIPDMSGIAEIVRQSADIYDDDQARWQPSDESCSVHQDTHHLCLMAKKNKKKTSKKDQVKEKTQVDDQDESDVEVEDNYNLDHLNPKDKFIIMKIVEKE